MVQTHSKCEGNLIRSFSNCQIVNTTYSNCTSIQQNQLHNINNYGNYSYSDNQQEDHSSHTSCNQPTCALNIPELEWATVQSSQGHDVLSLANSSVCDSLDNSHCPRSSIILLIRI